MRRQQEGATSDGILLRLGRDKGGDIAVKEEEEEGRQSTQRERESEKGRGGKYFAISSIPHPPRQPVRSGFLLRERPVVFPRQPFCQHTHTHTDLSQHPRNPVQPEKPQRPEFL